LINSHGLTAPFAEYHIILFFFHVQMQYAKLQTNTVTKVNADNDLHKMLTQFGGEKMGIGW